VLGTPPAFILSQDQTLRQFDAQFCHAGFNSKLDDWTSYHFSVVKVPAQKEMGCSYKLLTARPSP
jgi:hypothetical protein